MPEIFNVHINSFVSLSVWDIIETEEFFYSYLPLSDSEKSQISQMKLSKRRFERLGCRAALFQLLDEPILEITYSPLGAPLMKDKYLSFAHSSHFATAAISSQKRIGVDLEKISSKIDKLYPKFLSEEEIFRFNISDRDTLYQLWCAKEAAYKLYQKKNLDFIKQIKIENFDKNRGEGGIVLEEKNILIDFYSWKVKDVMLVLAIEK